MVTAGLWRSICPACIAWITLAGSASVINFEPNRQGGHGAEIRHDVLHLQHVGPELLVAERIEAEYSLAVECLGRSARRLRG